MADSRMWTCGHVGRRSQTGENDKTLDVNHPAWLKSSDVVPSDCPCNRQRFIEVCRYIDAFETPNKIAARKEAYAKTDDDDESGATHTRSTRCAGGVNLFFYQSFALTCNYSLTNDIQMLMI